MHKALRISEAEWQVMKVIWRRKSCTAQDVKEDLGAVTQWELPTVKTLINRLLQKEALTYEKTGKMYVYQPAVSEEDCQAAEAQSFLDRVFDGSLSPMIAHFVNSKKLSPAEISELERLLKKGKS